MRCFEQSGFAHLLILPSVRAPPTIQFFKIDEPAIREGLPLRRSDWSEYLEWSVNAFLISSAGVTDECQIHTHSKSIRLFYWLFFIHTFLSSQPMFNFNFEVCYSDFNDIFEAIKSLDADCITIENSKSDLKLLRAFEKYGYTNGIGPGLYDIHSPRVPSAEEMAERLTAILQYIKKEIVWVNPDCGLKTRGWTEGKMTPFTNVSRSINLISGVLTNYSTDLSI